MSVASIVESQKNYAGAIMEESLLQAICSGELPAGTILESTGILAKKYNVSIKTAQKALQELSRSGYLIRRNGAPTVVAERHSNTIGLILPNMGGKYSYEGSKIHYLTIGGILSGCNQNNLNMMVIHSGSKKINIQKLQRMNLCGIILLYPFESDTELLTLLPKTGLPLVCINLLDENLQKQYKFINFDYFNAGQKTWEYFRKHNVRHPAFFSRIPLNTFEHRQYLYEGLKTAAAQDGVDVELVLSEPMFQSENVQHKFENCRMDIERLLADSDAVLFGETWEAELYRSWGYEHKYLCGFFDVSSHMPYFSLDYEQIGINALTMLIDPSKSMSTMKCLPDARNMDF